MNKNKKITVELDKLPDMFRQVIREELATFKDELVHEVKREKKITFWNIIHKLTRKFGHALFGYLVLHSQMLTSFKTVAERLELAQRFIRQYQKGIDRQRQATCDKRELDETSYTMFRKSEESAEMIRILSESVSLEADSIKLFILQLEACLGVDDVIQTILSTAKAHPKLRKSKFLTTTRFVELALKIASVKSAKRIEYIRRKVSDAVKVLS